MPRSRVGKALTQARPKTHGSFAEGAAITDKVMRALAGGSRWDKMSPVKREATHMIVHKLHRIVTGDPMHKDHWDDIGGYAQLGADDCEQVPAKKRKVKPSASLKKAKPVPAKKPPAGKKSTSKPSRASSPSRQRSSRTSAKKSGTIPAMQAIPPAEAAE